MSTPAELARIAESLDDPQWYEFLDALDEVSRRRRQQRPDSDQPSDLTRDGVALWVARKHFLADRSIREIWHLRKDAPADEIRLLEVSEFLAPAAEQQIGALDFGLKVGDRSFRLCVADVATAQLEQVRHGAAALPEGWTLEDAVVWRRSE